MVSKKCSIFISLLFLLFSLVSFSSFSQQDTLFYRITFTDKAFSSFDVNNPSEFLSQRAIARRSKFNIAITSQDLPISQFYLDSILSFSSVEWKNQSKWFNSVIITCRDTNDINLIAAMSFVESSVQTKINVSHRSLKFDELRTEEKEVVNVNIHYPYGITYNQNHLHKIDYLHDMEFKGQGIHIAVIDAGFENANSLIGLEHLFNENRILSTKDFVTHDGDVYLDHFHGAAVLSVIAGKIEGQFFGTAPKASFHLLRSEDADAEYILEEDYWVSAAEYADSAGADIINTSLGYTTFDDSTTNHSYSELDGNTTIIARASNIAVTKGMFLCTSAGNLGDSNWGHISTPADADDVLTVGAIDSLGIRGSFSSYGLSADGDIKPNVMSVGHNCYLIAPWDGTIIRGNGTSFSSPMMAGMVACLWQALPDVNNEQLKQLIEESSHQYSNPDSLMGYGIPDFYAAYTKESGVTFLRSTNLKVHSIYPNPKTKDEELNLLLSSHISQEITLSLIDAMGRIVHSFPFQLEEGKNFVNITQWKSLSSGAYRVQLKDAKEDLIYLPLIIH